MARKHVEKQSNYYLVQQLPASSIWAVVRNTVGTVCYVRKGKRLLSSANTIPDRSSSKILLVVGIQMPWRWGHQNGTITSIDIAWNNTRRRVDLIIYCDVAQAALNMIQIKDFGPSFSWFEG